MDKGSRKYRVLAEGDIVGSRMPLNPARGGGSAGKERAIKGAAGKRKRFFAATSGIGRE
jgi:hypothetical protein